MWILKSCILLTCMTAIVLTVEETWSKRKARQSYNFDRKFLTGPHHHHSPPQFFPGLPRSYRKDYGENDNLEDPIDRGGKGGTIYIPNKPFIKVVEKPIYIKEPEPIIEIIIKESNVTLPPPPTEPPTPPPKKKKEEVQVFYVKYKKNPGGYGKDAVIYDKPIPAISPVIPEEPEPEPEEEWRESKPIYNEIPQPRPPSTTLRTIIKPDSETYHSPGGDIKVTFGKEGFDYDKRSSKPDDYFGPRPEHRSQQPRALTSYSDVYFKRPDPTYQTISNQFISESRQPQVYRSSQFNKPPPFFPQPKYPFPNNAPFNPPSNAFASQRPYKSSFPTFSHTISHPPPPQFQYHRQNFSQPPKPQYSQFADVPSPSQRKPVPYTPFENLRPPQESYSQPVPSEHHHSQVKPTQPTNYQSQQLPQIKQNVQFNAETRFQIQPQQQGIKPSGYQFNEHRLAEANAGFRNLNDNNDNSRSKTQQNQIRHHLQVQEQQTQQQQHYQLQQNPSQHLNNIGIIRNALPPGGELVHSIPRFEQHLLVNPSASTSPQALPLISQRTQSSNSFTQEKLNNQRSQSNAQPENTRGSNQVDHTPQLRQPVAYSSTPRIYISSTEPTTTTTTQEPEKPSTTTKDPKILEAQLPDEVPEELRQQLLSSGILNNADISILDYDKVGDIPLSALPPDQLANFYSAGGAQQLAAAGSESVYQVSQPNSKADFNEKEAEAQASEISEVKIKPEAQALKSSQENLKGPSHNLSTGKDKDSQEAYVADPEVDQQVLNDNSYNRYLPLRINGTQFPLDGVTNLNGREISDVVVLAPVTDELIPSPDKPTEVKADNYFAFIGSAQLKQLLTNSTSENYRSFLESENVTAPANQSVILLVTRSGEKSGEKEIFMYDVATRSANKLNGELSSAFVEVAEANSPGETLTTSDSIPETDGVENVKETQKTPLS